MGSYWWGYSAGYVAGRDKAPERMEPAEARARPLELQH
jgi:hypothetical protein